MVLDMPRRRRVEYPGAIYHVMSRGDRREAIFKDDVDRQDFLKTMAESCQKTGFEVHAYCLMLNHFHIVLKTPEANLVAGMRWFLSGVGGAREVKSSENRYWSGWRVSSVSTTLVS